MKDAHEVLGVPEDADEATIRKAFIAQARVLHPDVSDLDPISAKERFQALNAAYDLMRNPHQSRPHEVAQQHPQPVFRFSRETFDAYRKRMQARRTYGRTAKRRRRRSTGIRFGFMGFDGGR